MILQWLRPHKVTGVPGRAGLTTFTTKDTKSHEGNPNHPSAFVMLRAGDLLGGIEPASIQRVCKAYPRFLSWNVVVEARYDFPGEGKDALVGGVGVFAGVDGGDDTHQSTVTAVQLD